MLFMHVFVCQEVRGVACPRYELYMAQPPGLALPLLVSFRFVSEEGENPALLLSCSYLFIYLFYFFLPLLCDFLVLNIFFFSLRCSVLVSLLRLFLFLLFLLLLLLPVASFCFCLSPNPTINSVSSLACSRRKSCRSSCSPDFGVGGVSDRLGQISPKLVFFSLGYLYGGRWHDCRGLAKDVMARLPGMYDRTADK